MFFHPHKLGGIKEQMKSNRKKEIRIRVTSVK